MLTWRVAPEHAGQRLDRYIQTRIPRLSRTRAQQVVKACAYRHDGTRRRASDRVRAGEIVMLVRPRFEEPETPQAFGVLYADEAVLAVDKPAGLPVHPSATYHRNTLTFLLREQFGDEPPQIAHRLDRETSGVILCGRYRDAERALKRAFEDRAVEKAYLAIVRGRMEDDEGEVALPLAPVTEGLHLCMEVRPDGAPAVTRYRVEERSRHASLVRLWPKTGRQHQLRVHLSAIGHPIVGDKLYGPDGQAAFVQYIDEGLTPELVERLGHPRQALHAAFIALEHPVTGKRFEVASPLPPDLRELWRRGAAAP